MSQIPLLLPIRSTWLPIIIMTNLAMTYFSMKNFSVSCNIGSTFATFYEKNGLVVSHNLISSDLGKFFLQQLELLTILSCIQLNAKLDQRCYHLQKKKILNFWFRKAFAILYLQVFEDSSSFKKLNKIRNLEKPVVDLSYPFFHLFGDKMFNRMSCKR